MNPEVFETLIQKYLWSDADMDHNASLRDAGDKFAEKLMYIAQGERSAYGECLRVLGATIINLD